MNIAGRWVPLAVANTIFILWAVAIAVLGIVVWWLGRRASKSSAKETVTRRRRGNRRKR